MSIDHHNLIPGAVFDLGTSNELDAFEDGVVSHFLPPEERDELESSGHKRNLALFDGALATWHNRPSQFRAKTHLRPKGYNGTLLNVTASVVDPLSVPAASVTRSLGKHTTLSNFVRTLEDPRTLAIEYGATVAFSGTDTKGSVAIVGAYRRPLSPRYGVASHETGMVKASFAELAGTVTGAAAEVVHVARMSAQTAQIIESINTANARTTTNRGGR